MLASWRPTAKIRSSHSQEQHLWGGWRLAQAWEEQLYNCWWSVGQRFWACSPHGSPDLISAMLRTGRLIIQHCTKATILLMGAKSGSPHSAVLCGGDRATWDNTRWRAAAQYVVTCCLSAQSKLFRLTEEWNSSEKQMSYCLSPPACKEAGISVHYNQRNTWPYVINCSS